jgi:hypothetical protein
VPTFDTPELGLSEAATPSGSAMRLASNSDIIFDVSALKMI